MQLIIAVIAGDDVVEVVAVADDGRPGQRQVFDSFGQFVAVGRADHKVGALAVLFHDVVRDGIDVIDVIAGTAVHVVGA